MISQFQKRLQRESRVLWRKRLIRRLVVFFVMCGGVLVGIGWLLFSSRFRIDDIQISRVEQIDSAPIRAVVERWLAGHIYYVIPKNTVLALPTKDLKREIISSFPTIRDAVITRSFPRTLLIDLKEYDVWGVLCHGEPEKCFWIDRNGTAFDNAPEFSGVIVPKIHDNRIQEYRLHARYLSDNLMRLIAYFNERAVSSNHLQSVQFIIDAKDATLRVRTRLGWDILLIESSDPEQAYKNLSLALNGEIKDRVQELEYIDLRFGNRIFYKFRNQ